MIQIRPRSSKVIATGLTMSGSAATTSTWKPGGTVIVLAASAAERGGFGAWSWPCGIGAAGWACVWARTTDAAKRSASSTSGRRPRSTRRSPQLGLFLSSLALNLVLLSYACPATGVLIVVERQECGNRVTMSAAALRG